MKFERVAALGAGVIGASWTALFLASGRQVSVFDPDSSTEKKVRAYIESAWPVLDELGLVNANSNPDALNFHRNAKDAVADASFIQESVPEQLPIKHALFQEIETELASDAIVATSASGLTLS